MIFLCVFSLVLLCFACFDSQIVDLVWVCFFFFKQKTAYEMRISGWSSDVCSSDLMAASPATVPGETIGSMVNKAAVFEAMLRSGGWLATLPEAVRQAVFKASSVRTIAPGAALFEQDGPPTGLHGVFSGDIRVVGLSRDGRERKSVW